MENEKLESDIPCEDCGLNIFEAKNIMGFNLGVCECGKIRFTYQYYDKIWIPIHPRHVVFKQLEGEIK